MRANDIPVTTGWWSKSNAWRPAGMSQKGGFRPFANCILTGGVQPEHAFIGAPKRTVAKGGNQTSRPRPLGAIDPSQQKRQRRQHLISGHVS